MLVHVHRLEDIVMDKLETIISNMLDEVTPVGRATFIPLHLAVWLDGTKTGSRSLVAAKVRIHNAAVGQTVLAQLLAGWNVSTLKGNSPYFCATRC